MWLRGSRDRPGVRAWLELAGFWALAIAHPVLSAAVSGPDALTQFYVDRVDVVVLLIVTMLITPTLLLAVELAVARLSASMSVRFHVLVLAVLVGLMMWQATVDAGVPAFAQLLVPVLGVGLSAYLLMRSKFAQQIALVLGSLAVPGVAAAFLVTVPVTAAVLPADDGPDGVRPGSGTPVVVLIVDELPLAALSESTDRIDPALFPNFADLAADSTWYRNARTVGDSTITALPAMLTGEVPDDYSEPPSHSRYPDNLYTYLLPAGYEISAQEAITQLCPHETCPAPASRLTRLSYLLVNGAGSQPLPRQFASRVATRFRDAVADEPRTETGRFDGFIDRLKPSDGRLALLHSSLPHVPWRLLPAGQSYEAPEVFYELPTAQSEADQAAQRMMLQTAYVDARLGDLRERMEANGLWRRSLLVVVADHGGSLQPGIPRRSTTPENAGWTLPVPLFVKYPGQTGGKVVSRTVTTDRLLATILDVTSAGPPEGSEARSLRVPSPSVNVIRVTTSGAGQVDFSDRRVRRRFEAAVNYRNRLFGGGSFYAVGGRAELLGRRVSDLGSMRPAAVALDDPDALRGVDPESDPVPAYVGGALRGEVRPGRLLAFALNGRVVATGRAWRLGDGRRFATMIPVSALRPGANRFEVLVQEPARSESAAADEGRATRGSRRGLSPVPG